MSSLALCAEATPGAGVLHLKLATREALRLATQLTRASPNRSPGPSSPILLWAEDKLHEGRIREVELDGIGHNQRPGSVTFAIASVIAGTAITIGVCAVKLCRIAARLGWDGLLAAMVPRIWCLGPTAGCAREVSAARTPCFGRGDAGLAAVLGEIVGTSCAGSRIAWLTTTGGPACFTCTPTLLTHMLSNILGV
jgi:hypothetical protein